MESELLVLSVSNEDTVGSLLGGHGRRQATVSMCLACRPWVDSEAQNNLRESYCDSVTLFS